MNKLISCRSGWAIQLQIIVSDLLCYLFLTFRISSFRGAKGYRLCEQWQVSEWRWKSRFWDVFYKSLVVSSQEHVNTRTKVCDVQVVFSVIYNWLLSQRLFVRVVSRRFVLFRTYFLGAFWPVVSLTKNGNNSRLVVLHRKMISSIERLEVMNQFGQMQNSGKIADKSRSVCGLKISEYGSRAAGYSEGNQDYKQREFKINEVFSCSNRAFQFFSIINPYITIHM